MAADGQTRAGGLGDDERAFRWRLHGRVQGVSFRWFTRRAAQALGLRGDVRNLLDGRVEVRVMGPAAAVERLRAEVLAGPALARVDGLEEEALGRTELDGIHHRDGFEITI